MRFSTFLYGSPFRPSILAIALCCTIFLCGCGKTNVKTVDLPALVTDVETKAYLVQRFQAQFEQTRRSGIFNREISVRGNLVFEKPGRFHLVLSGDVDVEILSDGHRIAMIHDGKDMETFHLHGERDLSKFADPLMVLLQSMGNGGLRKFSVVRNSSNDGSVTLEATPTGNLFFERTKKVIVRLSDSGELQKVTLEFDDGGRDETVFRSWMMLAQDDPEIVKLNKRLEEIGRETPLHPNETGQFTILNLDGFNFESPDPREEEAAQPNYSRIPS